MEILEKLKSKLENTSLSENEIGVYLSLLKIGESTTGKILDDYKMSAGKIYVVLNKLIKKGLVSYILKNNVKYFKAQDPKNIIEYLEIEKNALEEKEGEIKLLLPEIHSILSGKDEGITVDVYEGWDGLKTALYKVMEAHEVGSVEYQFENLDFVRDRGLVKKLRYIVMDYDKKAIKKKIKAKILISSSNLNALTHIKEWMSKDLVEYRYIKGQKFATILFTKGKVLLFDFDKPSVVFIRSKAIAESFIKMFEGMWELGEKV